MGKLRHGVSEMYCLEVVLTKLCLDKKLMNPNSPGKIFFHWIPTQVQHIKSTQILRNLVITAAKFEFLTPNPVGCGVVARVIMTLTSVKGFKLHALHSHHPGH